MYKLYYPGIDQVITETDNLDEMKKYLDKAFERDVGPVTMGLGSLPGAEYYAWKIVDDWVHMDMWERAQNYMGEDYSEYFVFLGQHRDSEPMEISNFHVALERLGGESDTVIVAGSGHWLVGWTEQILIHQSDEDMIYKANDMVHELEEYPVLDEDDYDRTKEEMDWDEDE